MQNIKLAISIESQTKIYNANFAMLILQWQMIFWRGGCHGGVREGGRVSD
jgi:hypothetical protein